MNKSVIIIGKSGTGKSKRAREMASSNTPFHSISIEKNYYVLTKDCSTRLSEVKTLMVEGVHPKHLEKLLNLASEKCLKLILVCESSVKKSHIDEIVGSPGASFWRRFDLIECIDKNTEIKISN
jgi:hypothetical protein